MSLFKTLSLLAFLTLSSLLSKAQVLSTPLADNSYLKVTSYEQLVAFVTQLDQQSKMLQLERIGQSAQGRDIFAMKFSSGEFAKDESKIKVLFFAQQHGNEQSGKEGALLLALELLKPENRYLFDKMDFVIIPQMNPDGSEINKRRNGHDMDLNRNHLILTEPETQALHRFFEKYMFDVNMDVHEYSPMGSEWEQYGYRKNASITLGATTNINISPQIRQLARKKALPFVLKYLADRNYTSFEYCPGGPPEMDYIRHSTFDINDGRQSFGILNTFSFIQEGMNGEDMYIENMRNRAEGQCTGMRGMLEFIFLNKEEIVNAVEQGRTLLVNPPKHEKVSIQSDHFANGQKLELPMVSYSKLTDTLVVVNDYRPVVKSLFDVEKPSAYLIPKANKELTAWIQMQRIHTENFVPGKKDKIEQYYIKSIDSIDFERDMIVNPVVEMKRYKKKLNPDMYLYVPCNQLKGNMIVLALEPKSMLGLVTYTQYAHLLKAGTMFPVLRVRRE